MSIKPSDKIFNAIKSCPACKTEILVAGRGSKQLSCGNCGYTEKEPARGELMVSKFPGLFLCYRNEAGQLVIDE